MPDQPNKPGSGDDRPVDDEQAVKNQGGATPDDYPEPAGAEPAPKK